MIWFILMMLFVVLWRQAEKRAEQNFKAYNDLRQSIINLAQGKKTVNTKELTKRISEIQSGPLVEQVNGQEYADEAVEDAESAQPNPEVKPVQPYVDAVADRYGKDVAAEVEDPVRQSNYAPVSARPQVDKAAIFEADEFERPLSPKEIAIQKERTTLRNLNIMLYMASFLLVAAAAAFIAAAMPEIVRLVGLLIVVLLFYTVGLALYMFAPRFKPAAIAFVGTGLAILPFIGAALTLLGEVSGSAAWLVTSLIGLAAYVYAGAVLNSQVVSYLSMAFVLSAASSAVSVADLSTVWYFISLIGVSLVASTISYFKPGVLPSVFRKPIETAGQIVTPISLVGSIFASHTMTIQMYELLFCVSTAHYLVVFLQRRTLFYETVVRLLGHITLLIVVWGITGMPTTNETAFGLWWMLFVILQVAYSLTSMKITKNSKRKSAESIWIVASHIALVLSLGFWTTDTNQQLFVTLNLVALGGVALLSALVTRRAYWGYVSLVASIAAPFTFGRGYADPEWSYTVLMLMFAVLATSAVAALWKLRYRRSASVINLLVVSVVAYVVVTILCGILEGSVMAHGVSMILAGAILLTFSYAGRLVAAEYIGAAFVAYGTGVVAATYVSEIDWKLYVGAVIATFMLALGSLIHHYWDKSKQRRDGLAALSLSAFAILAFTAPMLTEVVRIATLLLLLAILMSLIGLRWLIGRDEKAPLRTIFTVGYISYLFMGWMGTIGLNEGWAALYYTIATAAIWLASRIERKPAAILLGNTTIVMACLMLWRWLKFDPDWEALCVSIVAAGVLYGAYAFYISFRDVERQWLMLVSSWIVLICGVYFGYVDTVDHQLVSVLAILGSAAMLLTHRYVGFNENDYSRRLTILSALASVGYLMVGMKYAASDAQLASWTFAAAAVMATWLSYRLKNRWIEIIATVEIVLAIWFAVSLMSLGDWQLTATIAVSTMVIGAGAYIHHYQKESERRNSLLMTGFVILSALAFNYRFIESGIAQVSIVILAAMALLTLVVRWLITRRGIDNELRITLVVGCLVLAFLAWTTSFSAGSGWITAASLVAAVVYWSLSYTERVAFLISIAHLFVFTGTMHAWQWLNLSDDWIGVGVALISGLFYYSSYLMHLKKSDTWRETASLIATVITLAFVPIAYSDALYDNKTMQAVVYVSIIAASLAVTVHGLLRNFKALVEISAYAATFAMQGLVATLNPDIELLWYAHWWAIVVVLVALWRRTQKTARFAVAMGLVTLTTGIYALSEGGGYQLLFLVEHVALLAAGGLLRKQWAVWWGIAASVVSILYFIKDYTFLWLAMLGLGLIVLVVWRLNKLGKS